MIDFLIKIKQHYTQNLPFVVYKKPKKNKVVGLFQHNDHLYFAESFKEKGFVFAPFVGQQFILIPANESIKWQSKCRDLDCNENRNLIEPQANDNDKTFFEKLVAKGVTEIKSGKIKKIVLSRQEIVEVPDFDLIKTLQRMLNSYPEAFCYCWFHPKIGLWMGATPEKLLKSRTTHFQTMALAGTQVAKNEIQSDININWGKKEIEEQQFVTEYILENLKPLTSEVAISSPYTTRAGKLYHINTDIEGQMLPQANLNDIVSVLHPTPAICGLPKVEAQNFILKNENYDRSYYTGYLGELNIKEFDKHPHKSELYVNIRCMQINNQKAYLYIGCGITANSSPENEWIESVNKSNTMKRVL
jgi:isochorismate synthase